MKELNNYDFQIPTPACNPGPMAERAMYGFVVYIACFVVFGTYLIFAYVPHSWLNVIGITYLPHRHWAITFPLLAFLGIVFVFVGYNVHHWTVVTPVTSIYQIKDDCWVNDAMPASPAVRAAGGEEPTQSANPNGGIIPPLVDLDPAWVTEQLYVRPAYSCN
ncbi:unnamed protein product [Calicophoron daubneyi]|uniref:PIG-P domain-containing protein n=1 Tax=Calicophoron daubneyi TaxID=300641 RepID=A0AAV2TWX3_CALDB